MRRTAGWSLLLLVPSLLTLGCIRAHGPERLRHELAYEAGVELHREMGITVTRSGMWIARMVMKHSDDDDEIPSLQGVRRVEVGIYEVTGLRDGVESPRRIGMNAFEGWSPLVRIHEAGEEVLVFTREQDESIRGLLVVVAEPDEWVVVRLKGKLDRIMEDAIEMAFDETDRPDLYARTREERGLDPVATLEP